MAAVRVATRLALTATLVVSAACGGRTPLRVDGATTGGSGGGGAGGASATTTTTGSGAGGACHDAVVAVDGGGALALALRGDEAFWISGDGFILRAPLDGGDAAGVIELLSPASSLAIDANAVDWSEGTQVLTVPVDGGAVNVLADGQSGPFALAADAGELWWLDYGAGIFAGSLVHRRVDGAVETLVTGLDVPKAMRIDATHAYFLAEGLLIPDSSLYGVLARVPRGGGGLEILLVGLHQPAALALDADRVYWLEQLDESLELDGVLASMEKTGAGAKTLAHVPGRLVLGLAVDATDAYVTSTASSPIDGALHRIALAGGAPAELAALDGVLYGDVALTDDAVVWCAGWTSAPSSGTPSVRKLCK